MMKALTLGTVSKFYSFLPQNIQSRVSIEFDYVTENELVRMLDLLAVIIVLKYLLSTEEVCLLIDEINNALETLLTSTKQLQKPQMFKYMGFPNNWTSIKDAPLGCGKAI